ncbi:hypothetical protein Dimus_028682, partial [Dionaea muscipula]
MKWSRSVNPDLEPEDCAQARSNPLEKNLPSPTVTRAEIVPEEASAWDLTSDRADRIESIRVGLRRCSPSPFRVRTKTLPCFSRVHMLAAVAVATASGEA